MGRIKFSALRTHVPSLGSSERLEMEEAEDVEDPEEEGDRDDFAAMEQSVFKSAAQYE